MSSGKQRRTVKPASTGSNSADEAILEIDGRSVQCTRLNKLQYPVAHFTKAQVIDYYVRVAPFLVPHFRNRPVTLKRYPDGVTGEAFWEKDAPSFTPEWVERFPVPRRAGDGDIDYILINNAATLAWAANAAVLEFHPFLHRKPDIQHPTSIVFDLDPGQGATLLTCAQVAFLIRDVFQRLGLDLFAKVSGSKGLQLYLPLNMPVTYDVTQPFARSIAQSIEQQHPDVAVSEMAKTKRTGRVFIDWSQNADFKTTVGVYSLRAKSERPFVSMPVSWDELAHALKRKDSERLYFAPKEALERLQKIGDIFAPVLTLKQKLPPDVVAVIGRQTGRTGPNASQLREYAAKRDFAATAEPVPPLPRRSAQGSKRRFVIQKHAASHLHYDFRLEMHDVLKSWAVPKGVPYEPGIRRLASATEDHPVEYLDFEGIIPQGQYGGGTVMVWDIGTYEIVEGNYWKGYLHVSLAGSKLQGEWTLRRTPEKAANAWILERTGPAVKAVSPAQENESALTGRTMAEIAAAKDAEWQSNRPAVKHTRPDKAALAHAANQIDLTEFPAAEPEFVEPMQAKLVSELPAGAQWEYEAKFDGYRALVIRGKEVTILSRRNNSLTRDFPAIAAACEPLDPGTALDGEIVALD